MSDHTELRKRVASDLANDGRRLLHAPPEWVAALLAERDALAARLSAIETALRELHFHHDDGYFDCCAECGDDWPCPTIRALDNREDPR